MTVKAAVQAPQACCRACGRMVFAPERMRARGIIDESIPVATSLMEGTLMKELEERIAKDGVVKEGGVLKVGTFLNHQCDVELFDHMGAAWAEHFAGKQIDKILTVEASGIGIACCASRHFGNVPVVFAKKTQSINLDGAQ